MRDGGRQAEGRVEDQPLWVLILFVSLPEKSLGDSFTYFLFLFKDLFYDCIGFLSFFFI